MSDNKTISPPKSPVYAIECHCLGMGIRYFSRVRLFGVTQITMNKFIKDAIFYLDSEIVQAERQLRRNRNNLDIDSYRIIKVN